MTTESGKWNRDNLEAKLDKFSDKLSSFLHKVNPIIHVSITYSLSITAAYLYWMDGGSDAMFILGACVFTYLLSMFYIPFYSFNRLFIARNLTFFNIVFFSINQFSLLFGEFYFEAVSCVIFHFFSMVFSISYQLREYEKSIGIVYAKVESQLPNTPKGPEEEKIEEDNNESKDENYDYVNRLLDINRKLKRIDKEDNGFEKKVKY